ncbi:MAG: DNA mismatch repair endonuclease MutL [Planctomycetota bacterium]
MSRIQVLSRALAEKIAAGEVIERPASIVKELVENAIDAKASRVEITIEDGGRRLIRVTDDGEGMDAEDLALAFRSHATSKIREEDDLYAIATLGFRGEALPSIARVAEVTAVSRPRGAREGHRVDLRDGEAGPASPAGAPEGTSIEVRNLFGIVPARRKFLKSAPTEAGHVAETVARLALAHPEIHFTLRHNRTEVYRLPPAADPRDRIAGVLGKEAAGDLLECPLGALGTAYVSAPGRDRPGARLQYLFLNRRPIRDRMLAHAVTGAYERFLLGGRHPAHVIFLKMDPREVDVNVHPAKSEVRFRDARQVHDAVLGGIRNRLLATSPGAPAPHSTPATADRILGAVADYAASARADTPLFRDRAGIPFRPGSAPSRGEIPAAPVPDLLPRLGRHVQLLATYILEETEEGLILADQHALHESILYEEIEAKLAAEKLEIQPLLVPETIPLTGDAFGTIEDHRAMLAALGFTTEPFGGTTVLLRTIPAVLKTAGAADVLRDLLDALEKGHGGKTANPLADAIARLACRAAVKAGDVLSPGMMETLLARRASVRQPHTCAHGRPTHVVFTKAEIERRFGRK